MVLLYRPIILFSSNFYKIVLNLFLYIWRPVKDKPLDYDFTCVPVAICCYSLCPEEIERQPWSIYHRPLLFHCCLARDDVMQMKARPQQRMSTEFCAPGEELRLGFDGGMEVGLREMLERHIGCSVSFFVCRTEVTTPAVCHTVLCGRVRSAILKSLMAVLECLDTPYCCFRVHVA